ncbi:MAG: hypothetical protein ABSD27_13880 [Bryobacteraceae bacterium]
MVAGAIGVVSFVVNIYQYFKIQSLRQGIDSVDRIAKSAKMECSKLEQSTPDAAERAKIRVLSALVSAILNVTTTFMKFRREHFNEGKSAPFISVD